MSQEKIAYLLTRDELNLLRSVLYLEPGLIDSIEGAKKEGNRYIIRFCPDNIMDVLGSLSFATGYVEPYTEKEKHLKLHDKIKDGFIRNKRLPNQS